MTLYDNGDSNNISAAHTGNIKEQLEQAMGVIPSEGWFNDCYDALRQDLQCRGQPITAAMILEQIVFHDIRDVVRNNSTGTAAFDENQNLNVDSYASELSSNAILLRKAIDESQRNDCKVILPSSFRLLVQVEEMCDISINSESRFTNDTTGTASVITGSSMGCHKICCVDGFYPGQPFVAIEVTPCINRGTNVVPGTKILLAGPITVRQGIMGWHTGNIVILGGQVERLIHIHRNEMKKIKQMSGHGIDPTIRALIWNQQQHEDMLNDDEGMVSCCNRGFLRINVYCTHTHIIARCACTGL
jgi:RecQ mediated genome instability protein